MTTTTENTNEIYTAALACANALDWEELHNQGPTEETEETLAAFRHLEEVSGIQDFLESYPRDIDHILGNPFGYLGYVNDSPEARADRMVAAILRWRQQEAEEEQAELDEENRRAAMTQDERDAEDVAWDEYFAQKNAIYEEFHGRLRLAKREIEDALSLSHYLGGSLGGDEWGHTILFQYKTTPDEIKIAERILESHGFQVNTEPPKNEGWNWCCNIVKPDQPTRPSFR